MQILQFDFNPEKKDDLIFGSFCCAPDNIYERRMGGLYMVGELKNALPHNFRLLEKTAQSVKKEFYSKFQRTHERALKESLKKANEFLSGEVSRENTDWLGNLNFAVISLKNFDFNFTKVGTVKIFLIRGPHIINIDEKLNDRDIEPYPLKIFNNIVSGKLGEGDVILAVTENVFSSLKGAIGEISKVFPFDEKKVKDILQRKKIELTDNAGLLMLMHVTKPQVCTKKPKVIFQKPKEQFSFSKAMSPALKYSRKILLFFKAVPPAVAKLRSNLKFSFRLPKISLPGFLKKNTGEEAVQKEIPVKKRTGLIKVKVKVETEEEKKSLIPKFSMPKISFRGPKFSVPKFRLPSFKMPRFRPSALLDKKYISVLLLIIILLIGFFIFGN